MTEGKALIAGFLASVATGRMTVSYLQRQLADGQAFVMALSATLCLPALNFLSAPCSQSIGFRKLATATLCFLFAGKALPCYSSEIIPR